jgi:hypothetical protein
MRLCLGNQVFRNSYFDHTDDLERATNRLAQSSTFYAELNQALTDLYYFKKTAKKASPSDKSKIITVYNARIKACLGNVIIYLVVPKINSLKTEEEKKKFINQVLSEVSDNREIFAEVQHLLKSELFMSPEELKKEKEKIKLFDSRAQVKAKIIDLARSDSLDKEAFIINHDGTIKFKNHDLKYLQYERLNESSFVRYMYGDFNYTYADVRLATRLGDELSEDDILSDLYKKGSSN